MKTKTMKKALSLFLAVLMIALAIPFTLLTVAAEEATEVKIVDFTAFGKHVKTDDKMHDVGFYASMPAEYAMDGFVGKRSDNNKDSDAQILNNTEHSGLGTKCTYYGCYFDEDGVMQHGTKDGTNSYKLMFIVELESEAAVDTLELWTAWGADNCANEGYDIYYSLNGEQYTLGKDAGGNELTFVNTTADYYESETFINKDGVKEDFYVHTIDMNGVAAKYIAIAVSEFPNGMVEAFVSEVVVKGTEVQIPDEPSGGEEAQPVAITKFSVYGRHADEYDTPLFFNPDYGPGRINDSNITTEAQSKNGDKRPYEMCYFDTDGTIKYGKKDGRSEYYGIFVIELSNDTVVDTLSLWTPTKEDGTGYLWGIGCMANDAYDIYYSADGETYAAVENASYSDVCAKQSTDDAYYIKDSYNGQTGYVHAIDMGGVTAECIAIAVSGYMPDSGNADYKEMIFYEAVVTGTAPKLMLETGASIRIDEPTGIRFTGLVSKSYVEKLESEGKTVTMGMLITPTNYLEGIEFTKAALDGKTFDTPAYLEIDAAEETVKEDGDYYVIKCVIAKIKEANYDREFSAILYVKVDGEIVAYSDYNEVFNSRSVAEVAEAAYCDLKDAKDDTYKYEVKTFEGEAEVTKYSPYDTNQREVLYGFFGQREQD